MATAQHHEGTGESFCLTPFSLRGAGARAMELCNDSSDEEPAKAASPTANTRPASTVSPPSAERAQQPKKTRRPRGGLDPVQQASHPISGPLGSRRGTAAVQQRLDQEARAAEAAAAKLANGSCKWQRNGVGANIILKRRMRKLCSFLVMYLPLAL